MTWSWERIKKFLEACSAPPEQLEQNRERSMKIREELLGSRQKVIERLETLLVKSTTAYNRMCRRARTPEQLETLRSSEKRLLYFRSRLEAFKQGKKSDDIDVAKFLQAILTTADHLSSGHTKEKKP